MVTTEGITTLREAWYNAVESGEFLCDGTYFPAAAITKDRGAYEGKISVTLSAGENIPVGKPITRVQLKDGNGAVLAAKSISLLRGNESTSLLYRFEYNITATEE